MSWVDYAVLIGTLLTIALYGYWRTRHDPNLSHYLKGDETIRWGTIAPRSQYVLILLAVTFTWLMGLMGFARSGIRQHWHVYGVMRDTSTEAVTPALGYAANVMTLVTIVFFALVTFIFWLGGLSEKGKASGHGHAPAPVIAGGSDGDR